MPQKSKLAAPDDDLGIIPDSDLGIVPDSDLGIVTESPSAAAAPKFQGSIIDAVSRNIQSNPIFQLLVGGAKGAASTLTGISKLTGMVPPETTTNDIALPFTGGQRVIGQPEGGLQNAGYYGEQVGEFLAPAGMVGRAAKGVEAATAGSRLLPPLAQSAVNVAARMGLEGLSGAGVTAAQTGDLGQAKQAGAFSAAVPAIGAAVAPIAAPLKQVLSTKLAPRFIGQLIRPPHGQMLFGKDPSGEVARMGITANSIEELAGKINAVREDVGQAIDRTLKATQSASQVIDVAPLINGPIDDAIKMSKGNTALETRLENYRKWAFQQFGISSTATPRSVRLRPIDARKFKTKLGNSFKWSEDPIEASMNDVEQKIYGNISSDIDKKVPLVAPLNAKYGNLLAAEKSAEMRKEALGKASLVGLTTPAIGVGTGILGGLMTGQIPAGVAIGLLTLGTHKLAVSTPGATRIATALAQLNPAERSALATRLVPVLKAFSLEGMTDKGELQPPLPER
jgi:hypothetical protein